MKKTIAALFLASQLALAVSSCKSTKIQVIDDSSGTNRVQNVQSGFNDETYIWEGWLFSTNRVDK